MHISQNAGRQGMKQTGRANILIDALLDLYRITSEGYAQQITDTAKEMTAKEPHSFSDFANGYSNSLK